MFFLIAEICTFGAHIPSASDECGSSTRERGAVAQGTTTYRGLLGWLSKSLKKWFQTDFLGSSNGLYVNDFSKDSKKPPAEEKEEILGRLATWDDEIRWQKEAVPLAQKT